MAASQPSDVFVILEEINTNGAGVARLGEQLRCSSSADRVIIVVV
jgi:uncharacterized Zn-binding protein involved in type VI secretion